LSYYRKIPLICFQFCGPEGQSCPPPQRLKSCEDFKDKFEIRCTNHSSFVIIHVKTLLLRLILKKDIIMVPTFLSCWSTSITKVLFDIQIFYFLDNDQWLERLICLKVGFPRIDRLILWKTHTHTERKRKENWR
jgi:hypothetical protein